MIPHNPFAAYLRKWRNGRFKIWMLIKGSRKKSYFFLVARPGETKVQG